MHLVGHIASILALVSQYKVEQILMDQSEIVSWGWFNTNVARSAQMFWYFCRAISCCCRIVAVAKIVLTIHCLHCCWVKCQFTMKYEYICVHDQSLTVYVFLIVLITLLNMLIGIICFFYHLILCIFHE